MSSQQLSVIAQGCVKNHFSMISKNYNSDPAELASGFYLPTDYATKYYVNTMEFCDFGKGINILSVVDRQGESVLSSLGNPATGRTNTNNEDRSTSSLLATPLKYNAVKTDTDVHIPYSVLNQWSAHKKMFTERYSTLVSKRMGLDRLIVGWHGESDSAATTANDPLMKDVNKGWLQLMREQCPESIFGTELEPITFGAGGTYENLDQVVTDMVALIPVIFRDGLVCIVGDELLRHEQTTVYSGDGYQKDKHKTAETFNLFGNIPRVDCPGFPTHGLVVTSLDNLSIYFKAGSSLRQVEHVARKERVEDFHTRDEAYCIENAKKFVALDHKHVSFVPDSNPE